VLVASPKLLEIRCRSIEDMRPVSALCRFVERASPNEPATACSVRSRLDGLGRRFADSDGSAEHAPE
jgi:hypothetical protein